MNETSHSNSRAVLWISILLAFLIGFFVGLVLFGWNLTPVEWTNANMATVSDAAKTRFLRASIDSYAYRGDDLEALNSYNSLGENKAQILSQIYADPKGLNSQDIETFAAAVGASQVLTASAAETGEAGSTSEPSEEEAAAPAAPAEDSRGLLSNPLVLGATICAVLVIAVLLAVILLALSRGRNRNRVDATQHPPQPPTAAESSLPSQTGEAAGVSTSDIPDWLKPANEDDPFQTVRLEEAGLAQVFEQDHEIDLGATPPRGLHLEEDISDENAEPAGEISEELTDEDLAAISAQDFSTRMPQPGATALIDESIASADLTEFNAEDQAWLDNTPVTEIDEAAWLETPAVEQAAAEEPTPEEMAPFEGEAPGFVAPAPDTGPTLDLPEVDVEETPDETYAKFSQDIAYVADISQEEAARLRALGVTVPLLLLKRGATPEGRQQIAEQSDLDADRIMKWVNDVDLFRVKGIDREFAALLQAAGVETIADLAGSSTSDLYARVRDAAAFVPDLRRLPSQGTVEGWIAQAKKLPRSVS